jgi:transposase
MEHFGIDLHQKHSEICGLDPSGQVKVQERVATSEAGLRKVFGKRKGCRVVLESGGQSSWAARVLGAMDHEVVVVNPRRIRLIAESSLKTDRIDAEILARLGRQEDSQLRPVYQRSEGAQELRTRLRVRTSLVRVRTALINSVRGTLRAHGFRMSSCLAVRFAARFVELKMEAELRQVLDPLVARAALRRRLGRPPGSTCSPRRAPCGSSGWPRGIAARGTSSASRERHAAPALEQRPDLWRAGRGSRASGPPGFRSPRPPPPPASGTPRPRGATSRGAARAAPCRESRSLDARRRYLDGERGARECGRTRALRGALRPGGQGRRRRPASLADARPTPPCSRAPGHSAAARPGPPPRR